MHLQGNGGLDEERSKMLTSFLRKTKGTTPTSFQCVSMKDIPIVEDLVEVNIFLYDLGFDAMIGELARKTIGKHSTTV